MPQPEQKKSYQVVKNFKGVNTQASRTAIDTDEFAWLENVMPVGFGNMRVLSNITTYLNSGNAPWLHTCTAFFSANINNNDYIFAFQNDGSCQYYNITGTSFGTVAAARAFSVSGVRIAQWRDDRVMILDPAKGLYSWDATNLVGIASTLGGSINAIGITAAGSGYTSGALVTIPAPASGGIQATATATVTGNAVTGITITNPGSGYTSGVSVTITPVGAGSGATVVASVLSFATGVVAVTMTSGGGGYTSAPTVGFSGGGGSAAAGTAIISGGQVIGVVMTNNGTGYTSNPTVSFSGGGGSGAAATGYATTNANVDVSSFSGRVWVAQGRTVFYSAAGLYNDFTSVSAGNVVLYDTTLHQNISALLAANNFLYVFGSDSINVFSDVRIQTGGSSIFTNTNVSASVGTKRVNTIMPYFRSVLFLNDYGVYALVGATTSKLSSQLDGIFPLIDFTQPVTAGQVLLYGSLCAAFSFTYNDPINGARAIQAVFFDKRWFFTSQDSVKYFTSVINTLWGTDGTSLFTLYTSPTAANVTIQSALWPMADPIRDKQALKVGVEATFTVSNGFSITIDSEYGASPAYVMGLTNWINNSGGIIPWTNNSSAVIGWANTGYQLYKSDAQQYGKYLGLTLTASSSSFVLNTLELEYELRARF